MPPRRRTRPAPPDVDALRTALELGKIVRVGIAPSGQFPDGVTGRVRSIGDPATDGDEYVMVEVPVGGSKDVLPFAPGDLLSAPGRRSADAGPDAPGRRPAADTRPVRTAPRPPGAREAPTTAHRSDSTEDELFPAPSPARAVASLASVDNAPTSSPGNEIARPAAKKAGAVRAKRPPVTITIATAGDESAVWRLDVRIGSRTAVRPTVVPPSRVWEIVESLGDEKVSGVVKGLLDDHRRATQARADALSAQLSLLQDELRLFPSADR